MSVIYLFGVTLAISVAVGFSGIIFQKASEKAYENETVRNLGQWLLLIPIIRIIGKTCDRIFEGTSSSPFQSPSVESYASYFGMRLRQFFSTMFYLVIILLIAYLLFWIAGTFVLNYFFEIIIVLVTLLVLYGYFSRR